MGLSLPEARGARSNSSNFTTLLNVCLPGGGIYFVAVPKGFLHFSPLKVGLRSFSYAEWCAVKTVKAIQVNM